MRRTAASAWPLPGPPSPGSTTSRRSVPTTVNPAAGFSERSTLIPPGVAVGRVERRPLPGQGDVRPKINSQGHDLIRRRIVFFAGRVPEDDLGESRLDDAAARGVPSEAATRSWTVSLVKSATRKVTGVVHRAALAVLPPSSEEHVRARRSSPLRGSGNSRPRPCQRRGWRTSGRRSAAPRGGRSGRSFPNARPRPRRPRRLGQQRPPRRAV